MNFQHLQLKIENHIAHVTLHRPPVNALNRELVEELVDIATQFKSSDNVWVVAVTATGKAFCAGADLKERAGVPQEQVMNFVKGIQSVAASWCEIPQPVIMGIHAPALGGGLEFALAGDILADRAVRHLVKRENCPPTLAVRLRRIGWNAGHHSARRRRFWLRHQRHERQLDDGHFVLCPREEKHQRGCHLH